MIDLTKPLQTIKHKISVDLITTNGRGNYPWVGYTKDSDLVKSWTAEGKHICSRDSELDLENVPPVKHVRYVSFYPFKSVSNGYADRKTADENSHVARIACIRVEYTEGQLDD